MIQRISVNRQELEAKVEEEEEEEEVLVQSVRASSDLLDVVLVESHASPMSRCMCGTRGA